ncbi:MAG: hypothetical protein WCA78_01705 [Rhizomicrobium sp.]
MRKWILALGVFVALAVAVGFFTNRYASVPLASNSVPSTAAPIIQKGTVSGPVTILGMELGRALALPPCKETKISSGGSVILFDPKVSCAYAVDTKNKQRWAIFIANDKRPNYFKSVEVVILDGKISEIDVVTNGIKSQDAVLADLINKFGEPASQTTRIAQNRFGATFEIASASWKLEKAGAIFFSGATENIDAGYVNVITDKAWKWSAGQKPQSPHL